MDQSAGPTGSILPVPVENAARTVDFWRRATTIYLSYKAAQAKALALRTLGKNTDQIREEVWLPQHEYAGQAMYDLCVTLRGFYLKAGQFIGSRSDFVPEPICRKLTLLCDKVPPMSEAQAREAVRRELGVTDLSEVFEWIDLAKPLGSASISQVHKARLRTFQPAELAAARLRLSAAKLASSAGNGASSRSAVTLKDGQGAWDICNLYAVSLAELSKLNPGINVERARPGEALYVPRWNSLLPGSGDPSSSSALQGSQQHSSLLSTSGHTSALAVQGGTGSGTGGRSPAAEAVLRATASGSTPESGLVAVKIQYPDALGKMSLDLKNIRAAAYYLSKTELKFDLVSAVDELNKQIRLEFDFVREARVMDSIAHHLRDAAPRISVPRCVPGLVTKKLLVMQYLEGTPLLDLRNRISELPERQREAAKARILSRVAEAYGRMILGEGLFQADGHPGNILVGKGANIGLLDYGQSKQLADEQRKALARLILELDRGDPVRISSALAATGVETETSNEKIRTEMAYGMFDTRGKVDPFDPNSPLKKSAIGKFPPDLFFVLRVVQLIRGMASAMGINSFSSASQWAPLARRALGEATLVERLPMGGFIAGLLPGGGTTGASDPSVFGAATGLRGAQAGGALAVAALAAGLWAIQLPEMKNGKGGKLGGATKKGSSEGLSSKQNGAARAGPSPKAANTSTAQQNGGK